MDQNYTIDCELYELLCQFIYQISSFPPKFLYQTLTYPFSQISSPKAQLFHNFIIKGTKTIIYIRKQTEVAQLLITTYKRLERFYYYFDVVAPINYLKELIIQ